MAITTQRAHNPGHTSNGAEPPARNRSVGRRRQLPLVVLGLLLVIGFALAFSDATLHLGNREEVLVVAQPLSAGQIVTASDLRPVRLSTGSGLDAVPLGAESSVLGRRAAVPLVAGALLTTDEVGATSPVGGGSDVVALALKSGSYPPDLGPGDRVQVVPVTSPGTSSAGNAATSSGSPIGATVLSVEVAPANSDGGAVISVQVAKGEADEVASLAAAGQASLVQVGG